MYHAFCVIVSVSRALAFIDSSIAFIGENARARKRACVYMAMCVCMLLCESGCVTRACISWS